MKSFYLFVFVIFSSVLQAQPVKKAYLGHGGIFDVNYFLGENYSSNVTVGSGYIGDFTKIFETDGCDEFVWGHHVPEYAANVCNDATQNRSTFPQTHVLLDGQWGRNLVHYGFAQGQLGFPVIEFLTPPNHATAKLIDMATDHRGSFWVLDGGNAKILRYKLNVATQHIEEVSPPFDLSSISYLRDNPDFLDIAVAPIGNNHTKEVGVAAILFVSLRYREVTQDKKTGKNYPHFGGMLIFEDPYSFDASKRTEIGLRAISSGIGNFDIFSPTYITADIYNPYAFPVVLINDTHTKRLYKYFWFGGASRFANHPQLIIEYHPRKQLYTDLAMVWATRTTGTFAGGAEFFVINKFNNSIDKYYAFNSVKGGISENAMEHIYSFNFTGWKDLRTIQTSNAQGKNFLMTNEVLLQNHGSVQWDHDFRVVELSFTPPTTGGFPNSPNDEKAKISFRVSTGNLESTILPEVKFVGGIGGELVATGEKVFGRGIWDPFWNTNVFIEEKRGGNIIQEEKKFFGIVIIPEIRSPIFFLTVQSSTIESRNFDLKDIVRRPDGSPVVDFEWNGLLFDKTSANENSEYRIFVQYNEDLGRPGTSPRSIVLDFNLKSSARTATSLEVQENSFSPIEHLFTN